MNVKKTSKFLSLVLRHRPEAIGIELDENGWVSIEELLNACRRRGKEISLNDLERVVENNDKKRFVIRSGMIRANQGHSVNISLGISASEPPAELFHGTAAKNINSIMLSGLVRKNRQHVHLSLDVVTARAVGRRHGIPVILKVSSGKMYEQGFEFYLSENNVWLTNSVPVNFIEVVDDSDCS